MSLPTSVRKPSNKGGVKKFIGRFPSFRLNVTLWFESLLERDYLCLLEFDHLDVLSFREQPGRIYYTLDGKRRRYTPDFYVERKSKRQIIEVKAESKALEEKYRALFRVASLICSREGYEFKVITEKFIRVQPRLNNVKLLLRYQRVNFLPQHEIYCQEFFAARRSAGLGEVMEFFAAKGVEKPVVYSLIRWGVLGVNLVERIDTDSMVYLPGGND